MHGLELFAYIRDLLLMLPSWAQSKALELAPVDWA